MACFNQKHQTHGRRQNHESKKKTGCFEDTIASWFVLSQSIGIRSGTRIGRRQGLQQAE
jgi:hypothetical protein